MSKTCIAHHHGVRPSEFRCSECGEVTLPTLYQVEKEDGYKSVEAHDALYCSNCGSEVVEHDYE